MGPSLCARHLPAPRHLVPMTTCEEDVAHANFISQDARAGGGGRGWPRPPEALTTERTLWLAAAAGGSWWGEGWIFRERAEVLVPQRSHRITLSAALGGFCAVRAFRFPFRGLASHPEHFSRARSPQHGHRVGRGSRSDRKYGHPRCGLHFHSDTYLDGGFQSLRLGPAQAQAQARLGSHRERRGPSPLCF